MRVKILFSYDGSKFSGFQRQKTLRSVQETIEKALSQIANKEIEIKGSGRTDAKVHANGQVAHFDWDGDIINLKRDLNFLVMPDICIKKIQKVSNDFHARFSAKKKEYIYKINLKAYQSSLNDYYYQPGYKIDLGLMKEAARYMLGIHDYRNFISGEHESYISEIYSITFMQFSGKLEIRFIGSGFYRYMVRNLVGALLEVGKCKIKISVIKKMLDEPNISKRLPTAPPEGLYLNKVWY